MTEYGAEETLTVKEYSGFMVLFNELIGLGISYKNGEKVACKVNTSAYYMPSNFLDFAHTIDGVPTGVYALKKDGISARSAYKSANVISSAYCGYLSEVVGLAGKNTGSAMEYTYYPALSYKQNGNVVFAAKFTVRNNKGNNENSIDKLFEKVLKEPTGYTVGIGQEFYVVFETHGPLLDISLPYSGADVKAVFIK